MPQKHHVWWCAGMVDDRGNYFAPCGWMKKDMSPFELVEGCKACAQRYHYRVKVPVTAGPRPVPPDPMALWPMRCHSALWRRLPPPGVASAPAARWGTGRLGRVRPAAALGATSWGVVPPRSVFGGWGHLRFNPTLRHPASTCQPWRRCAAPKGSRHLGLLEKAVGAVRWSPRAPAIRWGPGRLGRVRPPAALRARSWGALPQRPSSVDGVT